jgi:hypothetical protein
MGNGVFGGNMRKIVQISAIPGYETNTVKMPGRVIALTNDGAILVHSLGSAGWQELPAVPQPQAPAKPAKEETENPIE